MTPTPAFRDAPHLLLRLCDTHPQDQLVLRAIPHIVSRYGLIVDPAVCEILEHALNELLVGGEEVVRTLEFLNRVQGTIPQRLLDEDLPRLNERRDFQNFERGVDGEVVGDGRLEGSELHVRVGVPQKLGEGVSQGSQDERHRLALQVHPPWDYDVDVVRVGPLQRVEAVVAVVLPQEAITKSPQIVVWKLDALVLITDGPSPGDFDLNMPRFLEIGVVENRGPSDCFEA